MATREDFIKQLAVDSEESQATIDKIIKAMPGAMQKELMVQGEVRIPGVAIFRSKYMPSKEYVDHLHGGDKIKSPAKMRVSAKVASTLAAGLKVVKPKG